MFPLFRGVPAIFTHMSWQRAQRTGARIGAAAFAVSRRDRRRAVDHLAIAFPEMPPGEREALARRSFLHLGTTLAEALHLSRGDCAALARHVELAGWEHVEAARRDGRRIVILSAHCGNWELLAGALNCRGLGMAVVARALQDGVLDSMLLGFRARYGTETIQRGTQGAPRRLLAVLRGGGALGILIDQDIRDDGVWVPFFGRLAHTPVGAAEIALRQKAVVLPAFIERRDDGSHLATIHPPLALPADAVGATAAMTAAIEAQVRRRPEQWVWLPRRWRRAPPPDWHARRGAAAS